MNTKITKQKAIFNYPPNKSIYFFFQDDFMIMNNVHTKNRDTKITLNKKTEMVLDICGQKLQF